MRSCNTAEELGFDNVHQALLGNKESWLKAKFYFLKVCEKWACYSTQPTTVTKACAVCIPP